MSRILFVGDLNAGGRSLQRSRTLAALGHEVVSLSTVPVPFVAGVDSPSLVSRVLWKMGRPQDPTGANAGIVRELGRQSFDLLWIDKGVTIRPATIRDARRRTPGLVIVSCSEDDMNAPHNQSRLYLGCLPLYDVVFTTKTYNLGELRGLGARRTELFLDSFDESLHRPIALSSSEVAQFGSDVGFVGTFEDDRASQMQFLAENGARVTVWGNGWSRWVARLPSLDVRNQAVTGDDYARAICGTKVNLCFLRKINRDEVTSRSVEIPACGGFMLAERTKRHEEFFRDGQEAVFFSSREELLRHVRYYLEHEDERRAIAAAGRERCLRGGYSMREQLKRMIATAMAARRADKP